MEEVLCRVDVTEAELRDVQTVCRQVCKGFGQTKVVEDGNREARARERQDALNRKISITKQWDALRSAEILGLHRRRDISGGIKGASAHSDL